MIVPPALLSILEGTKRVTTLARIDWSLVFEHGRQTLFARRPNLCIRRVSPSFGGSMRRIARYRVSGRVRDRQPTTIPPLAYIASWYHKLRGEEEVQVFAGNSSISFQPKGCVCVGVHPWLACRRNFGFISRWPRRKGCPRASWCDTVSIPFASLGFRVMRVAVVQHNMVVYAESFCSIRGSLIVDIISSVSFE